MSLMTSTVYVLMVMVFFALATVYVRACASVVGSEPPAKLDERSDEEPA